MQYETGVKRQDTKTPAALRQLRYSRGYSRLDVAKRNAIDSRRTQRMSAQCVHGRIVAAKYTGRARLEGINKRQHTRVKKKKVERRCKQKTLTRLSRQGVLLAGRLADGRGELRWHVADLAGDLRLVSFLDAVPTEEVG